MNKSSMTDLFKAKGVQKYRHLIDNLGNMIYIQIVDAKRPQKDVKRTTLSFTVVSLAVVFTKLFSYSNLH